MVLTQSFSKALLFGTRAGKETFYLLFVLSCRVPLWFNYARSNVNDTLMLYPDDALNADAQIFRGNGFSNRTPIPHLHLAYRRKQIIFALKDHKTAYPQANWNNRSKCDNIWPWNMNTEHLFDIGGSLSGGRVESQHFHEPDLRCMLRISNTGIR